jgi:hypothetical protein
LDLFNDNELPASLQSSCLALVAQQEIHSNPAHPSPNINRYLDQVPHGGNYNNGGKNYNANNANNNKSGYKYYTFDDDDAGNNNGYQQEYGH